MISKEKTWILDSIKAALSNVKKNEMYIEMITNTTDFVYEGLEGDVHTFYDYKTHTQVKVLEKNLESFAVYKKI